MVPQENNTEVPSSYQPKHSLNQTREELSEQGSKRIQLIQEKNREELTPDSSLDFPEGARKDILTYFYS